MSFGISGQCGKYNIFLFLPLQYTDLTHEKWRFLVYIFLELHYLIFYYSAEASIMGGGGDHTRKLRGRDVTVSLSVKVKPLSVFVSSL